MSKLPTNLVAAPIFDSPFRRTESPDLAIVSPKNESPSGDAIAEPVPSPSSGLVPEEVVEERFAQRKTIRLTTEQYEALEARVFELRMKGERKVNSADLIRRIIDEWSARR